MDQAFSHMDLQRQGEVFCARLRQERFDESAIAQLGQELCSLIDDHGCRRLVINLGPKPLECLYSMFIGKLVAVRRKMLEHGGAMTICQGTPDTLKVFEAVGLKDYFNFAPDEASAVAALGRWDKPAGG